MKILNFIASPLKGDINGNENASQRKDKLRERVGGKAEKVQSIGDEPADGPDSYCVLKDFDSPKIFSLLQELHSVQINSIITLMEANKTDINSSCNSNFLSLRQECQKTSDASLWKNTVWASIESAETHNVKELQDKIAVKIYSILIQRKIYTAFYEKETYLEVPEIEDIQKLKKDLRYYHSVLNSIENQKSVTEDLVLAMALEQVSRAAALEAENPESKGVIIPEEATDISTYFGNSLKKLATTVVDSNNQIINGVPAKAPYVTNLITKK